MIKNTDRDDQGRLKKGHSSGGRGNPHAGAASKFRAAIYECLTTEDIQDVLFSLLDEAKNGNVAAAKELLDRTVGKAEVGPDVLEKVELLENLMQRVTGRN